MRVALITETFLPNVNGVVTTLCRLLEHLRDHGHEALLIAPETSQTSYAGAEIVPLRGVPLPAYPELRLTPPQPGLTAQLRRFQPDIVHLAGTMALGVAGRHAARQLGVPLVGAYHTDFPAYTTHYGLGFLRNFAYRYLRWVHNSCALTLCPSLATISDLRTHGFRRLRLWSRGVDTERFHPRHRSHAWRTAVGATADERILLYVGRLAPEKRIDLLAEVLPSLPNTRLVLVGDGPARPILEQRLAGAPAHFCGYLRGEALATAYASADLFVFPSDTETFGQVIQEAMASALPVVAAQAGGAIDLVRDGTTGALFQPGNPVELRQQIMRLLEHPAQCAAMGAAGRHAAERRSWSHVMDELLGHYQTAQRQYRRMAV
ncbi:glycosyltransferase family 4 protein [Candidatus Oscillochloris fontis]|uniref:glycosyltransferase family 4 protein n=1 Tax=Candidatus Oscillochloris fontis TaxID=2496868 RepID=UPI00101C897B|nr:glycosyltransferase family 1 protein [Candidatus Oscillochloris fontis]